VQVVEQRLLALQSDRQAQHPGQDSGVKPLLRRHVEVGRVERDAGEAFHPAEARGFDGHLEPPEDLEGTRVPTFQDEGQHGPVWTWHHSADLVVSIRMVSSTGVDDLADPDRLSHRVGELLGGAACICK